MSYDLMPVDMNGLGYAACYVPALAKLAFEGMPTAALHGGLTSLFAQMDRLPGALPLVVWDGHAKWRYDLYPDYKANRQGDPARDEIRRRYALQVPHMQMFIAALGIPQVRCGGAEADDVAGHLCREMDPSWRILLATNDGDWFQGLRENVDCYSPAKRRGVNLQILSDPENGFDDGHFLTTREYIQAKALAGDKSDNIGGIEGVGMKTATKIMREQGGGTIAGFWEAVDSGAKIKGKVAQRVATQESRDIYERNLKLMDWTLAPALPTHELALTAGSPCWREADAIAAQFGLGKVLAHARRVLEGRQSWGPALGAVDAALHSDWCAPIPKVA